jgi:predicted Zn-dependent peptidase
MSDSVRRTVLDSGIRVLSEYMPGVRSVSVGVLVEVGSRDESSEERGYAHLLEHMLFQGTGDRDAKDIAEMMEIGGGGIGAFTTRDYTVYHATVLDEYLPFALEVLGDMLCNSVLPEEALERQRSVILNEIADYDDPLHTANDLLKETLWPDHPMGFPTAGLESTLRNATRASLLDFMQRHYVANRIVIAAAGSLDHDMFLEQVRDSFWQSRGSAPEVQQTPPQTVLKTVIAEPRDMQTVYFSMAWPAPNYTSPARYAYHAFSSLYGGGPTSRLYRVLREERGMVYHIGAQYHAYGSTGALVVDGATQPHTLIPVIAGTLIELMRMSQEGITLDDHHRSIQSLISQHLVSGDSSYVRMSRLALQEAYFHSAIASADVISELQAQSPDDVQRVAQKLLMGGLPTLALVGPVNDGLVQAVSDMLADFGEPPRVILTPQRTYNHAALELANS